MTKQVYRLHLSLTGSTGVPFGTSIKNLRSYGLLSAEPPPFNPFEKPVFFLKAQPWLPPDEYGTVRTAYKFKQADEAGFEFWISGWGWRMII